MKPLRLAASIALLSLPTACQQAPTPVPVRSLERSSKTAFLCLNQPGAWQVDPSQPVALPLDECTGAVADVADYSVPHLFGLVTQTVRGEIALLDVTAGTVFDTDPSTPGYNFQPVGANPADIVVTPGGYAAFVGVDEPSRPGLYALPTAQILTRRADVTAWPACALPGSPGAMVMMVDPPEDAAHPERQRASCDAPYTDVSAAGGSRLELDLRHETREPGTRKIVVAIPELGELDVVDAQDLLDRVPGSFDACKIERRIPLAVDLAAGPAVTPPPDGGAGESCAIPAPSVQSWRAHPSALDLAGRRLVVADDAAPVIHVLDAEGPCSLAERAPLLPSSVADPRRAVTTSSVAVSPLTSDGKQFAYAVDLKDGSIMAFDVGPDATSRAPIQHRDVPHDPFEPRDRIALGSPVRAVTFAQRDVPYLDPNGISRGGVACDPRPGASATDPAGVSYRTAPDYSTGAGPANLRGIFAFAVLQSGVVAVIDVDDFDAPCRRPPDDAAFEGCAGDPSLRLEDGDPKSPVPTTSRELSCNVVERHRLRAGRYFAQQDVTGHNAPSLQTYPTLVDKTGSQLSFDDPAHPKLLGPSDGESYGWIAGQSLRATLASSLAGGTAGAALHEGDPAAAHQNWVAFDFHEPRAHVTQDWGVTYEGQIPGFGGHVGRLQCAQPEQTPATCDPQKLELWDPSGSFCDRGVLPASAFPRSPVSGPAEQDLVTIADGFLDDGDPYWRGVGDACSPIRCRTTFGPPELPTSARDLPIAQAYQDHLVLEAKDVRDPSDPTKTIPIACCFPTLVSYQVRAGGQWIVAGSVSGFVHDVVADPATLACVRSCDQSGAPLRNPRIAELDPSATPPALDDPRLFRNAQMQFAIWRGKQPSVRDMSFGFHVTGGFSPLVMGLSASSAVAPQSVTFVSPLGELALPDAASQGVVFLSLTTLGLSRQFL